MRLAVLKIGGRLAANNRSSTGGTNEAIEICKRLVKYGVNVTFFTKVLESDDKISEIDTIDLNKESFKIINKKNYDLLLVFNGNANFFGGAEDELSILNYMVFFALFTSVFSSNDFWKKTKTVNQIKPFAKCSKV